MADDLTLNGKALSIGVASLRKITASKIGSDDASSQEIILTAAMQLFGDGEYAHATISLEPALARAMWSNFGDVLKTLDDADDEED